MPNEDARSVARSKWAGLRVMDPSGAQSLTLNAWAK